ncbi:MAG TPA: PDZ domain-containing protein [Candidatus Baltobacteraceae bacterium]|nr:PDZ domain-containing protein [Candidatus Baltobacteraceae bacterium]
MFTAKRTSYAELARLTIVPVVLGLVAGIAGALTAESYLAAESFQVPPPIQIGRPSVSVTSPLPETEIAERLRRVNMPLYARKPAASDVADRAHSASEIVGYASVLTSDGWLVTHQAALAGPVSVAVDGRLIEPTAQVVDARTGAVFLKVDAAALDVSGFEDTDVLLAGTPLYAAADGGAFAAAVYAGAAPSDKKVPAGSLRSTDRFSRTFRLDRALGAHAVGSAVLTVGGNLAGIVAPGKDGNDAFIPMHLIRPVLVGVFRGQEPARAALGAHYLALGETVFAGQGFDDLTGARLTSSRALGLQAVRVGTAAGKAGLQDGDVILAVDEVEISGGRDLAELIGEYAPGARARFDILRAGERRTVEVTFD